MSEVVARQLEASDAQALHALMGQVFAYLSDRYYPAQMIQETLEHYTVEDLTKRLQKEHMIFLGCFDGDEMVAFVFGSGIRPDGLAYIDWIGVHPDHLRRGYFSHLLGEFEEQSKKMGAHKVYLYTSRKNIPAIQGYLRNGYSIEGTHPDHFMGLDFLSLGKVFKHSQWKGDFAKQPDFNEKE